MKKLIDINLWKRKEHFDFFKNFEEPFHGVCVEIDCGKGLSLSQEYNVSFFIYYLHKSIKAMNKIEALKYRLEGEEVYLYEQIDASATIGLENGVFGYSHINYHEDLVRFNEIAQIEIARVKSLNRLISFEEVNNVVHYSVLPWIHFTGLSHARKFSSRESIPKVSFGKLGKEGSGYKMPMSIHVHHALVDGRDLGSYIDLFQHLMDGQD